MAGDIEHMLQEYNRLKQERERLQDQPVRISAHWFNTHSMSSPKSFKPVANSKIFLDKMIVHISLHTDSMINHQNWSFLKGPYWLKFFVVFIYH